MSFTLIAAVDEKGGIGKKGKLPWRLAGDLAFFQKITTGGGRNAVIMGRTTWESIPVKHRPLIKRLNIVLTRNNEYLLPHEVLRAETFEEGLEKAKKAGAIFIIGGQQVFAEAIAHRACTTLLITEVAGDFGCDTFFPKFDKTVFRRESSSEVMEENGIRFQFVKYQKATTK